MGTAFSQMVVKLLTSKVLALIRPHPLPTSSKKPGQIGLSLFLSHIGLKLETEKSALKVKR